MNYQKLLKYTKMGKIYDNQTDLTLIVKTGKDLTGITDIKIKTINPKGVNGTFIAEVEDEVSGVIKYIISEALVAGKWTCWAEIVDEYGLLSIGEPFIMRVNKPGN